MSPEKAIVSRMSAKQIEFEKAWIDYYTTDMLIEYGELSLKQMKTMSDCEIENYIRKRAKQMYEADVAKIRSKYADTKRN